MQLYQMDSLIGAPPSELLIHGPSKLLLHNYHWHHPTAGIISSYTPQPDDVKDHFGLFRGVDQIESFGQSMGSASVYLECVKQNCTAAEFKANFIPTFISVGNVQFHNYLKEGDTFINIGKIKFYKFRQMVADGRIYKVPEGLDLDGYFGGFTEGRLLNYDLDESFTLIAEINDITGRTIKNNFNQFI